MDQAEHVEVVTLSAEALFDEHWYRVKHLRPRLPGDVVVRRHVYRNVPYYVLHRPSNGSFHRADSRTFGIIGKLDGISTVDELWQMCIAMQAEHAPTQSEFMRLLAQLHESDMVTVNQRLNAEQLFKRGHNVNRTERRRRYLNPLFLRFHLFDPDAALEKVLPWCGWLFTRSAIVAWLLVVLLALLEVIPRWSTLVYELNTVELFSPHYALVFFSLYPLLKFLHEMAHGLFVKHYGGEVHEMGLALMVLLPIPYVDATAAGILADKRQRILVSAAGILVELGIAALAALVWVNSTGTLHEVALVLMLIGGLSTLVFNANPLLKFDGYYMLSDWLEIPSLADRSRRYLFSLAKRRLFAMQEDSTMPLDNAERWWLIAYGCFSTVYKAVLMASIAWMLSGEYFFFGLALALWILGTLVLQPLWRFCQFTARCRSGEKARVVLVSGVMGTLALGLLTLLPLPHSTFSEGVVWLPENAIVRVATDCDVRRSLVKPGQLVSAGDELFVCEDFTLGTRIAVLQAQLDELNAESTGLGTEERVKRMMLQTEMESVQRSLDDVLLKKMAQTVVAKLDGRFVQSEPAVLAGRFFSQGMIAAYVVPEQARTVRVAIEQAQMGAFQRVIRRVEIQFSEQIGSRETYISNIVRQTPKAGIEVPSIAMTTTGGGRLVPDPAGNGTTVLEPVFDVELSWPENAPQVNVGSHVQVKLVHAAEPVAGRLLSKVRRAFLGRVNT